LTDTSMGSLAPAHPAPLVGWPPLPLVIYCFNALLFFLRFPTTGRREKKMIVVLGEALIDMIRVVDASGEEMFRPVCGGAPFNVAVTIARLQYKACFVGARRLPTSFRHIAYTPALKQWIEYTTPLWCEPLVGRFRNETDRNARGRGSGHSAHHSSGFTNDAGLRLRGRPFGTPVCVLHGGELRALLSGLDFTAHSSLPLAQNAADRSLRAEQVPSLPDTTRAAHLRFDRVPSAALAAACPTSAPGLESTLCGAALEL
jgi:hypothetical protein